MTKLPRPLSKQTHKVTFHIITSLGVMFSLSTLISKLSRAKIVGSFKFQVSLWLTDLIGICQGDKSGRHSKNHGSLAGGISRGFAARDGYAVKSHSTILQPLRRQISPNYYYTILPATQAIYNVAKWVFTTYLMLHIYIEKNRTYLRLFVLQLHVVYLNELMCGYLTTVVWLLHCCVVIELTKKLTLNP